MLTIDEKDYDLNFLIHFDMLREILIKLAKNQKALQNDIDLIKKSNNQRDYKIMKIAKESEIDFEDEDELKEKDSQNNYNENNSDDNNKKDEKKEKDEYNKNKETIEIQKKEERITEKEKSKNVDSTNVKKEESKNNVGDNQEKTEKKISSKKNNNYLNILAGDKNSKQILNNLRECNKRVDQLEMTINGLTQNDFANLKKELKNHDLENKSDFKVIDAKFNEIEEKLSEYDKKIEDCTVKCASLDILNIIKDSGDGTIDGAKILFKSLEEKCFKKFELIDTRYRQDSTELLKMKKNVESFVPKLDKVNRDIEQIKEIEEQQKEEIINNKKETNNQNNNTIKLCEEKNDDILKKLIELKEEIDKDINNKMKEINEKIKLISLSKKEDDGASSLFKLGLVGKNEEDEEKLEILDKKINDIRKKTNDLENSFKIFLNEEMEMLKNDVKELKFKIDKKIQKEDLKELYNLHLSDVDDINDVKDRISIINDEQKKIIKDLHNAVSKLESLNGNMLLLQNSDNGGRGPIIDFTKYVDQQKLTDTLKPIIKEIEKIYKELDSFSREMNEVKSNEKLLEKKERVNKLEEEIYSKINELKLYCNRRHADKIETNKAIKSIEVQLKDLSGKKSDGDGWLMAKQPLKCFNCASCEANIKNTASTTEYIPWNKYPQGERIYRMGQGFSHMLQMMTSEFVKTFDHPDEKSNIFNVTSDNESTQNIKSVKNINNNALLFHSSDKAFNGAKLNNKEQIKEETLNFYRTGGKVKLPKMKKFIKKTDGKDKLEDSVPVSDEEKDYVGDSAEKTNPANPDSPRIMRISKKDKPQSLFNMSGFHTKPGSVMDYRKKKDNNFSNSIKAKMLQTGN